MDENSATIRLHTLKFKKSDLERAPKKDRLFFLMAGSLQNDLQVLSKLLAIVIASCPPDAHKIEKQADSAMAMLIQRLLAGRLYEGWNLMKGFAGRMKEAYEPDLSEDARDALKSLRGYFGSKKSHLAQVRNKVGFHADAELAEVAFGRLSDVEDLGSYICRTLGNTIHITPELMYYEAICEITGEPDFVKGMNILWSETQSQVSHLNSLMNGFTVVFAERYLPDALAALATEYDDVPALPLERLQLRYFSDLSNYGSSDTSESVALS
ncbi:hypothetical protein M3P36_03180 [Altererythrobacter sp. KTW20L]|uniref:hypothetical protein n=1 Tax=Altererythrobacter sp. KTW20L TaxID=2942210 RepID=UPI0020BDA2CE|nr:hypothetical protein [Altererythrobacter sp. KTW20L]MCL6250053.1 hypothetical protein [Altererythrobacter sp. KTW20L]